jgi:hypothetical protein
VLRDDRLVRGDDRLAGTERGGDERPSGFEAAHELDDDIRVGVSDEVGGRVGQQECRDSVRSRPLDVPHGHGGHDQRAAVGGHQAIRVVEEAVQHGAPDRASTEDGDPKRRSAHRRGS